MGKVLFSQVPVYSHFAGYPHLADRGYPQQGWMGYPPQLGLDGSPSVGTSWGYPPYLDCIGTPPVRTGWGYSPPLPRQQQSEHLLHGGRYASCVHAGGLSCYLLFQPNFLLKVGYQLRQCIELSAKIQPVSTDTFIGQKD